MKRPALDLPPGYLALVERLMLLVPRWCAAQPILPLLVFYDHGTITVGAALDEPGRKLLAKSPDAFALLEWLEQETNHEATIFQVSFVLRQLGFLDGAELLTFDRIRELGFGAAGVLSRGGDA